MEEIVGHLATCACLSPLPAAACHLISTVAKMFVHFFRKCVRTPAPDQSCQLQVVVVSLDALETSARLHYCDIQSLELAP